MLPLTPLLAPLQVGLLSQQGTGHGTVQGTVLGHGSKGRAGGDNTQPTIAQDWKDRQGGEETDEEEEGGEGESEGGGEGAEGAPPRPPRSPAQHEATHQAPLEGYVVDDLVMAEVMAERGREAEVRASSIASSLRCAELEEEFVTLQAHAATLCTSSATLMHLLCTHYAPPMHPPCTPHAPPMHPMPCAPSACLHTA